MKLIGILPDLATKNGWHLMFSIYTDHDNNIHPASLYLYVDKYSVSYLYDDGTISHAYDIRDVPEHINTDHKLYKLTETEIHKHIILGYI